jgi:hypothetical protein
MSWFINGTLFTGTIITVGSGKDYENINLAVEEAPNNSLLLVDPGSWYTKGDSNLNINKLIYVRGLGASPEDTLLRVGYYGIFSLSGGHGYYENLTIRIEDDWQRAFNAATGGIVTANKVRVFPANRDTYSAGHGNIPQAGIFNFKNCYLTKGHATFVYCNLSLISLDKVEFDVTPDSYLCSGSLSGDYVITPTEDYGYNYGELTIINILIPSVTTNDPSSISDTTISISGQLIDEGSSDSTAVGFIYIIDSTSIPTINFYDGIYSESGSYTSGDTFSNQFTGLEPETNYNIRAFAINSYGPGYGETILVTTTDMELPELITYDSTAITDCSFIVDGEILNTGSELIISPNPPENITGVEIWNANKIGDYELKYIIMPEITAEKYPNSLLLYSYPVTISWNTTDAKYVELSDDQGNVETLPSLSGSIQKTQIEKKVYTLTAYNGPQISSAVIQISAFVNKYEDSFEVPPPSIDGGSFGISSPTFSTVPEYVFIYQLPVMLSINHEVSSRVERYYTINNGTPTKDSTLYTTALSIKSENFDSSTPQKCVIKAVAYAPITNDYSPEAIKEIKLLTNSGPISDSEILAGDGEINLTNIEIVSGTFYETIIVWPNDIIDTDTTSNETIQITSVEIVSGTFYETIIVWPNDIIDTDTTSNETIQITSVEIVSGEWWQSVIEV